MSGTGTIEEPKKLDDVMLAMDIVDTLRHREQLIDRELSAEAREERMMARLKEIYSAQGIDVPDRILADGVKALEEKRFQYDPPRDGLAVRLAKIYIARDRWLKPLVALIAVLGFTTAVWHFGFEAPRAAQAEAARLELSETLPADLSTARDGALALAETSAAQARVEIAYQDGVTAISAGNVRETRAAIHDLERLATLLGQTLQIRVVSRRGEYSGVFRTHDDDPSLRNYYLIVEAVDAGGRAQPIEVASEEDQARKWVELWGVRVPEAVFNRIAADKQDDQIIQHAVIGEKPKGALAPSYDIETSGGAIFEW